MDIKYLYNIFLSSGLVSTDTRNIPPGSVFFALKGENFNGNRFALQAIENGASAAVVDEDTGSSHPDIIRVHDVLKSLQQLALHHRRQSEMKILAITGSNGKTTTKELCRAVLAQKFNVVATVGNLNNHIGVPLTLLSMDEDVELGIVEMGANHPGEIRQLCEIAEPDYGLITNVGKAHLEGFGSIEGVARAKGELFNDLRQRGKAIYLNDGDPSIKKLVPAGYPKIFFYNGEHGIRATNIKSEPFLQFDAEFANEMIPVKTNLLGIYNIENVLAALCVGINMGVPMKAIVEAIYSYIPGNNRSQLIETGRNRLYMDAYNANPSSMKVAVDEFLRSAGKEKLLILGEMRELGADTKAEHEKLVLSLKENKVKKAFLVGKAFEVPAVEAGFTYFENAEQATGYLEKNPVTDHFILIKGPRSNRLENILKVL
jgi:UDP-N-acetylmuramoyl-tripeptide--D-alanyl-D-alanine ligase